VALAISAVVPATARADEDDDVEVQESDTTRYQGAYWGLQVHTGALYRMFARSGDLPGPLFGASARLASVLSIADLQLAALGGYYRASASDGTQADIGRVSVGLELHGHPLFITILQNEPLWYWVAGLYGTLGVDFELTTISAGGEPRVEADFGWHLGAGMDIPLNDPNQGWGLWLGLGYALKFLHVDTGLPGLGNFNEHTFVVTLAYRNNDILFARLPRPSELDYRDPELPTE
jgi:hypothetical protein